MNAALLLTSASAAKCQAGSLCRFRVGRLATATLPAEEQRRQEIFFTCHKMYRRVICVASTGETAMTQPSERKEAFRLLRSHEVEDAIQTIRENPALRESLRDNGAGIRLLVEEPGLYNKWLYTIPDAQG